MSSYLKPRLAERRESPDAGAELVADVIFDAAYLQRRHLVLPCDAAYIGPDTLLSPGLARADDSWSRR